MFRVSASCWFLCTEQVWLATVLFAEQRLFKLAGEDAGQDALEPFVLPGLMQEGWPG
jgi:hypothetical protein